MNRWYWIKLRNAIESNYNNKIKWWLFAQLGAKEPLNCVHTNLKLYSLSEVGIQAKSSFKRNRNSLYWYAVFYKQGLLIYVQKDKKKAIPS